MHGVQVVTVSEEDACQAAFDAAPVCFALTNTRSLAEPAAAGRATRTADGLIAVAGRRGARLQLLSRSDSTPRGHVMAAVPRSCEPWPAWHPGHCFADGRSGPAQDTPGTT